MSVAGTVATAHAAFAEGADAWWPPVGAMRLDPSPGGSLTLAGDPPRVLADVAAADPGGAITLAWRALPDGTPVGSGAGTTTIRFEPVEDDLATVVVEHHGLTGPDGDAIRRWASGDDGWWAILRAFAAHVRA